MNFCPKLPFIALITALIFVTSCKKPEEYPIIPHIEFKNLTIFPDSVVNNKIIYLTITFTDGDGDIGSRTAQSQPSDAKDIFVTYFEKQKGKWTDTVKQPNNKDTVIDYNGGLPLIPVSGKNKNIKGDIEYQFVAFIRTNKPVYDTIAFQVYLRDRALHKSNVIMTPAIDISKY